MRVFMGKLDVADVVNMAIMLPLPFMISWVVIVSYKNIDTLEGFLNGSRLVIENKFWMQRFGLAGKVMRCSAIIAICMHPSLYVRDGSVVEKEVLAIPKSLKKKVYPPFIACTAWSVALVVWGVFGRCAFNNLAE
jgi:hypothetical protein